MSDFLYRYLLCMKSSQDALEVWMKASCWMYLNAAGGWSYLCTTNQVCITKAFSKSHDHAGYCVSNCKSASVYPDTDGTCIAWTLKKHLLHDHIARQGRAMPGATFQLKTNLLMRHSVTTGSYCGRQRSRVCFCLTPVVWVAAPPVQLESRKVSCHNQRL